MVSQSGRYHPPGGDFSKSGAITSKEAKGGDFKMLGSHKIFTFYLAFLQTLACY